MSDPLPLPNVPLLVNYILVGFSEITDRTLSAHIIINIFTDSNKIVFSFPSSEMNWV